MLLNETKERQMYRLFGDILDYPHQGLSAAVDRCESLVAACNPEGAGLLRDFKAFVQVTSQGRLEEIYSAYFDLNPVCYPYVGYHIFGESYKRSTFLIRLKELYRACGLPVDGPELPDRLSLVLRFLSISEDRELNQELIEDGLLPALDRITGKKPAVSSAMEGDMQLEGHSAGEVLGGGFVLEAMQSSEGEGQGNLTSKNPYEQALVALRITLESSRREDEDSLAASRNGGVNHA